LRATAIIGALCRCAELGGAAGVRVDGVDQVRVAKASTGLCVIGIEKVYRDEYDLVDGRPAITPGVEEALALAAAGADMVAVEATVDLQGDQLGDVVAACREATGLPVMADVSTFGEGWTAFEAGADVVATTLSGYTRDSFRRDGPDYGLIQSLAKAGVVVAAEGRIGSPQEAAGALRAGARFVVVGRAITDPVGLTSDFAKALTRLGGEAAGVAG
jgi:N-acylglucosamine-6-phosphate 2-epimerase